MMMIIIIITYVIHPTNKKNQKIISTEVKLFLQVFTDLHS